MSKMSILGFDLKSRCTKEILDNVEQTHDRQTVGVGKRLLIIRSPNSNDAGSVRSCIVPSKAWSACSFQKLCNAC